MSKFILAMLCASAFTFSSRTQGADSMPQIIAVQQAEIKRLTMTLQQVQGELTQIKKQQSDLKDAQNSQKIGQDATNTALQNGINSAQGTASGASSKLTVIGSGGGKRSCTTTCFNNSRNCVVAWAGGNPFETWTCDAAPEGNLNCLCY